MRTMAIVERVLARRRAERTALVERARAFTEQLDPELRVRAAVVYGSVARGDFNLWSDVDLLIIADGAEGGPLQRMDALGDRPALVEPVVWTREEWHSQLARGNPIAIEARDSGVWFVGAVAEI